MVSAMVENYFLGHFLAFTPHSGQMSLRPRLAQVRPPDDFGLLALTTLMSLAGCEEEPWPAMTQFPPVGFSSRLAFWRFCSKLPALVIIWAGEGVSLLRRWAGSWASRSKRNSVPTVLVWMALSSLVNIRKDCSLYSISGSRWP